MSFHAQLQLGNQQQGNGRVAFMDVSRGLLQFQRRDYSKIPHQGGIVRADNSRELELAAHQCTTFIIGSAIANGMGRIFDQGGGFPLTLSAANRQLYKDTYGRDLPPRPVPGAQDMAATRALKKAFTEAQADFIFAQNALKMDSQQMEEKNKMAAVVLNEITLKCISRPAFVYITSKWDQLASRGKHADHLEEIMIEINALGKNTGRVHEQLTKLVKEMPNCHSFADLSLAVAIIIEIQGLEELHLTRMNNAVPPVRELISASHPVSTDNRLLTLLLDSIAGETDLVDIRKIIAKAITEGDTLETTAASIRVYIDEHRPTMIPAKSNHQRQNDQRPVMIHAAYPNTLSTNPSNDSDEPDYYMKYNDGLGMDDESIGMEGPEQNQLYAMMDDAIAVNVGTVGTKRGGPPLPQQQLPQQHRRLAYQPPLPPQTEVCQFNLQGKCNYGQSCTKSHTQQHQPTNMLNVQMSQEDYNLFQMAQRSRSQQQTATNQTRMSGQYSNVKPSGHYGPPPSSSSQGR